MSENNRPDDKVNEEVFEEQRREAHDVPAFLF